MSSVTVCQSVSLFICLWFCLSVCLLVCLFVQCALCRDTFYSVICHRVSVCISLFICQWFCLSVCLYNSMFHCIVYTTLYTVQYTLICLFVQIHGFCLYIFLLICLRVSIFCQHWFMLLYIFIRLSSMCLSISRYSMYLSVSLMSNGVHYPLCLSVCLHIFILLTSAVSTD